MIILEIRNGQSQGALWMQNMSTTSSHITKLPIKIAVQIDALIMPQVPDLSEVTSVMLNPQIADQIALEATRNLLEDREESSQSLMPH